MDSLRFFALHFSHSNGGSLRDLHDIMPGYLPDWMRWTMPWVVIVAAGCGLYAVIKYLGDSSDD